MDVVLCYDVWLEDDVRTPAAPILLDARGEAVKNDAGVIMRQNIPTTLPEAMAVRLVNAGKAHLYAPEA